MNKIEFLEEVKNSNICPEEFESIYEEFCFYQKEAYKTLLKFHEVCEKNKISYQVAFGSLLGIIRDGGQIPWDYDVDVIVPYDEKNKLIQALDNDLGNDYYFNCIEKNYKCRHLIMRIAPKGFDINTLHVDVFFEIGTPNDQKERFKLCQRIKKISKIQFYKNVKIFDYSDGHIKTMIKLIIYKICYMFISRKKILKEYDTLCHKYDIYKSFINVCADISAGESEYESKYLWKTKIIEDSFKNSLRIPVNYKEILKSEYGDYLKIFPLENRINEMITNYVKLHRHNHKMYDMKKVDK